MSSANSQLNLLTNNKQNSDPIQFNNNNINLNSDVNNSLILGASSSNLNGDAAFGLMPNDYHHNLAFLAQDLLNEVNRTDSPVDSTENLDPISTASADLLFSSISNSDSTKSLVSSPSIKKVRKRKQNQQDDEEEETSSKNENTKKKKVAKTQYQRKNIKRVMHEEKLNEETLRAMQEEKERQLRLLSDTFQATFREVENLNQNYANTNENDFNCSLNNKSDQSVCLIEDDDDLETKNKNSIIKKEEKVDFQLVDNLSSRNNNNNKSSDDSDIIEEDYKPPSFSIRKPYPPHLNAPTPQTSSYFSKNVDENDDDDCRIMSDSERLQEEQDNLKKKLKGIHMNDDFNAADENGNILINVNHPAEDQDVNLIPYLARSVKAHQIGAIRFIYDNIVESLIRVKEKNTGFGCILA
jgi:hypothetical protein